MVTGTGLVNLLKTPLKNSKVKILLNIICVTYGKGDIYNKLLTSIFNESFDPSRLFINFILIDQNKQDGYYINNKCKSVNVEIIGSSQNGISLAKNKGLNRIKSGYVWFLDDDCIISKNAFVKIINYLNKYRDGISFIADNPNNKPFRIWPKKIHFYNSISTWYLSFTINSIFPYNKNLFLDKNLGIGSKYGSCEDVDFSIRYFKKLVYLPEVLVIHNDCNERLVNYEKIYTYSKGFGYLCRKHLPVGGFFMAFSLVILIINFFKSFDYEKFKLSAKGRFIGFFKL